MKAMIEKVIGAAIEVHRHLGPGLLESTYEICLAKEFDARGIQYERQKSCPIAYRNFPIEEAFRIDFLVEKSLILEIKAVDALAPIHTAQVLTYLRLLNYRVGFLLNFNVPILKNGIKRISL
jgi:GxxExxY protein